MNISKILSTTAALAVLAAAAPAWAQAVLPDVAIEGPIQDIDPTPGSAGTRSWAGTMRVMGVTIRVLNGATVHTPTNPDLGLIGASTVSDTNVALQRLDGAVGGPLPGRGTALGFNDGTAIITGDSEAGIIYATDVFSDFAENVIVGQATGIQKDADGVDRVTINNMAIVKLEDDRMPAGKPINGFGFEIDPTTVTAGLFAAEGYFASGKLHYHTLEADQGTLLNAGDPEVSILRANCRIRGRNRDELEVRGGTHTPANAQVTIQRLRPGADPQLESSWANLAPQNIAPVVDNTVAPPQGLYRYNASNLNLGTVCPAQVRAVASVVRNGARVRVAVSEPLGPDSR